MGEAIVASLELRGSDAQPKTQPQGYEGAGHSRSFRFVGQRAGGHHEHA